MFSHHEGLTEAIFWVCSAIIAGSTTWILIHI